MNIKQPACCSDSLQYPVSSL